MNWDIRVEGRRYRLRNRRMLSLGIGMMVLLAAAIICLVIGALSNASGSAAAPRVQSAGTAAPAVHDAATTASGQTAVQTRGKPTAGAQNDPSLLTLVNAGHPLTDGYRPETCELPNGMNIDKRAYGDLMEMISEGERGGLDFVICSAYRSYEKQQELYNNKVTRVQQELGMSYEDALEEAKRTVALPGTSEHNLGLAADIVAYGYQQLDNGQLDTQECKWLMENAWKYGFIMRYPADKKDVTHIIFEPWHYRYVGRDAAKAMRESGQCLEEYLGETD